MSRSALEVTINIMRILREKGPMLRTHLQYKAALCWGDMTYRYLPELFAAKMVAYSPKSKLVFLTPAGFEALGLLEKGIGMIGPIEHVYPKGPLRALAKKDALWTV